MRLPYLYCYVRFFITRPFTYSIVNGSRLQYMLKCNAFHIQPCRMLWVRVCCEHCECFSGFCCNSFSYFDETKRERTIVFHFALFYHSHFDESGRYFFGMKRCALTYAFDGMQPNENIQFQLFALRETDGHILPMYESEYKQHTHTHTQMSIVYDSLSMYECYMRTIKCNTYFFGFG